MRRVLLVAEGTLDRPLRNIISIFVSMTVILVCGFLIIDSGIPGPLMVAALAALLMGVAWLKTRFGGQREFRVEKRAEDEPLRITGRFEEGHVGSSGLRELVATKPGENELCFEVAGDQCTERFHLRPPAFSRESLQLLHEAISELQTLPPVEIHSRFSQGDGAIRFYDAKKLMLLRFHQKPGYMMILWLVAGLTVLFWLIIANSLPG